MKRAKIISMINYKGGVAKTTSTFNLAAGLTFLANKKVLIIDLDPQCSLTTTCLEAYKRKSGDYDFDVTSLDVDQTINHVFKEYLNDFRFRTRINIDLDRIILKSFYGGDSEEEYSLDIIPATMFDYSNGKYPMGLDDLQIEIASYAIGSATNLIQATFLSKFFSEYELDEKYDFIIFDCPPANNITTQNALVVSDYYLIPTIMDPLSSNGIVHLHNLINKTIFGKLMDSYKSEIEVRGDGDINYLKYIKKGAPKLLGIFETLKKPSVNNESIKRAINSNLELKGKIFNDVTISNLVEVSKKIGSGYSVFSGENYYTQSQNRPDREYKKLVINVLDRTESEYDIDHINEMFKTYM